MNNVGITVYVDNNEMSILEFGWLYKSWVHTHSYETSDIVVFYNPTTDKSKLPSHENILYVPSIPLSELESEWAYYPHINATYYLTLPSAEFLLGYKYIFKTDNDVFLTENFKNLQPRLPLFGLSAYASNPEVTNNLTRISAEWGVKQHFINVGATVMALSDHVLCYAVKQFEFCKRLKAEEFPNGEGQWPGWYLYVLNMYAGCLAANAVFSSNMTFGGLDVFCMSNDSICNTDYHIHAWHTNQDFSKFKWYKGEYNHIDREQLDKNRIDEYCLWIAGERTL